VAHIRDFEHAFVPPIQCVPRIKRPGREADHSPPSSTEV